jgi:hypothetical protein
MRDGEDKIAAAIGDMGKNINGWQVGGSPEATARFSTAIG